MTAAARDVATSFELRRRILLASDRSHGSSDLVSVLDELADVDVVPITRLSEQLQPGLSGIVVDINLRALESVQHIKTMMQSRDYQKLPRLFVLDDELHHGSMQAWALGATDTLTRPVDARAMLSRIRAAFPDSVEAAQHAGSACVASGVAAAEAVLAKIFDRRAGQTLTYEDILQAEGPILKAIKRTSLRDWLAAVGRHHKESYRLTLLVTGYAVAFAQHYGMREDDQRRLTRAALVFDVGKAFVDSRALDLGDRSTGDVLLEFQQHPRLGYEALALEGSFPRETLDVVLHHHELLDGTGYPDALGADQISDIVRLMTIFDLFASMVAQRRNHDPLLPLQAFCRMEEMDGKIDQHLLQAFRPIALTI